ncbi:Uncharacterised protein [Vibrio cholerae]|nr:Uncharacterised protein [Vibrio cholerae]
MLSLFLRPLSAREYGSLHPAADLPLRDVSLALRTVHEAVEPQLQHCHRNVVQLADAER